MLPLSFSVSAAKEKGIASLGHAFEIIYAPSVKLSALSSKLFH
jgi:hypothetical protein